MSSDRERLIELIRKQRKFCNDKNCGGCGYAKFGGYPDCQDKMLAHQLIESGVIVPPCKVGDIVYALWSVPTETKYVVYCAEVKKISQYKKNCRLTTVFEIEPIEFRGRRKEYRLDDFGKTVFLTKEEAEEKLKEMRDNC